MKKLKQMSGPYSIGFELSSTAHGFVATDPNGNVLYHGKQPVMGTRVFKEGQHAAEARMPRTSRRGIQRRRGREHEMERVFAPVISSIDPDEIRFYIVTGLARAGTADNHDIEVSVMFEVELRFFQGKTIIFREEKIVGRIRLILEGDSFFKGAPFRRPGFLSIAIVTGIHECVEPDDKNRNGESDCIQHGNRCH